jgi:hypothetical protein
MRQEESATASWKTDLARSTATVVDSSSIHGGLLLLTDPRLHVDQCVYCGAKRQGEFIPSLNLALSLQVATVRLASHCE